MIELLVVPFGAARDDRRVTAEVPLVERTDVVVVVGDKTVHRHYVVHDHLAHSVSSSPRVAVASHPIEGASDWLVENQSVGIGPRSGGNPCLAGNRRRSARYSVGV